MTTDEFIENVNVLDNRDGICATANLRGDVFLRTFCEHTPLEIVMLRKHAVSWNFNGNITIPTKILKLMVELAESRENDNKYVILNGKSFLLDGSISTRVFLIIDNSLSSIIVALDDLADFAYTKGELEQLKATLPQNLKDAVDLLTVTVSEAKKVLKNDN